MEALGWKTSNEKPDMEGIILVFSSFISQDSFKQRLFNFNGKQHFDKMRVTGPSLGHV